MDAMRQMIALYTIGPVVPEIRSDTYGRTGSGTISGFLSDINRTGSGTIRYDFQIPISGPVGPGTLVPGRSEGRYEHKTKETR
jgi:hypothetical protein